MLDLMDARVAITRAATPYPTSPPFSPPTRYPEFPYPADESWDPTNHVYPGVRELFRALGFDASRYGSKEWNPLGELIRPGDRVVLKPNYILHQHLSGGDPFSVITHSSIIRAVVDYVHIALGGAGHVLVADAPQANADWDRLVEVTRIGETLTELRHLHGVDVELRDLRQLTVVQRHGLTVERRTTAAEAVMVDLGADSAMAALEPTIDNLCGSDYDRRPTVAGHRGGHRYAAAKPILDADVLINLPKLKVHKKAGVTLSLKNMVGINANKNFIPHYRIGDSHDGGDEFPAVNGILPRLRDHTARRLIDGLLGRLDRVLAPLLAPILGALHRSLTGDCALDASDAGHNQRVIRLVYSRILGKPVRAGNWHGNDTLWRAIHDLNRIALYARADGTLADAPVRRYLTIIDGVIGGEGEGPMDPDPVDVGVLIGGANPVLVDRVATEWMGFDPDRFPVLAEATTIVGRPLAPTPPDPALTVASDVARSRPFRPPAGWVSTDNRRLEQTA